MSSEQDIAMYPFQRDLAVMMAAGVTSISDAFGVLFPTDDLVKEQKRVYIEKLQKLHPEYTYDLESFTEIRPIPLSWNDLEHNWIKTERGRRCSKASYESRLAHNRKRREDEETQREQEELDQKRKFDEAQSNEAKKIKQDRSVRAQARVTKREKILS